MVVGKPTPDFVIRLQDVAVGREELEASLGMSLDRYEPSRNDRLCYAQVSMKPRKDGWPAVAQFLEMIGPRIKGLLDRQAIGAATMDIAVHLPDGMAAVSSKLPAHIVLLAGQSLMDVETSVYLTSS